MKKKKVLVEYFSANTKFKFGSGVEVKNEKVKILAIIDKKYIEACIVNNDILLLLSKTAMKKTNFILNFRIDIAHVSGDTVDLTPVLHQVTTVFRSQTCYLITTVNYEFLQCYTQLP